MSNAPDAIARSHIDDEFASYDALPATLRRALRNAGVVILATTTLDLFEQKLAEHGSVPRAISAVLTAISHTEKMVLCNLALGWVDEFGTVPPFIAANSTIMRVNEQ